MPVSDFAWHPGAREFTWVDGDRAVRKAYDAEVVSAVVLRDLSGVAAVEPEHGDAARNAVVFDADGRERFRLERPCRWFESCHFAQIYYVEGELTAFIVLRGTDFAYVVDEETGVYRRRYETR